MTGATKKVFAIVVTYNGMEWIDRCLDSLKNSSYPVSVIVVDNRSADGTVQQIERRHPEVVLVKNDVNLGFGKANNAGLHMALEKGGDYFFLINQDVYIESDTVAKLVEAMENNGTYGIVSPLHFDGTGKKLDRGFERCVLSDYRQNEIEIIRSQHDQKIHPAGFINAAAWLISKKCLADVGGFGYVFYHYGEDRDYIQRLKYHKQKLGFIVSAKILHDRKGRVFDLRTCPYKKLVWYYFVGFLCRVSDVNQSFAGACVKTLFWCFKDLVALSLKGRPAAIMAFFEVSAKGLGKLNELSGYRHVIRQRHPFLFINNEQKR